MHNTPEIGRYRIIPTRPFYNLGVKDDGRNVRLCIEHNTNGASVEVWEITARCLKKSQGAKEEAPGLEVTYGCQEYPSFLTSPFDIGKIRLNGLVASIASAGSAEKKEVWIGFELTPFIFGNTQFPGALFDLCGYLLGVFLTHEHQTSGRFIFDRKVKSRCPYASRPNFNKDRLATTASEEFGLPPFLSTYWTPSMANLSIDAAGITITEKGHIIKLGRIPLVGVISMPLDSGRGIVSFSPDGVVIAPRIPYIIQPTPSKEVIASLPRNEHPSPVFSIGF